MGTTCQTFSDSQGAFQLKCKPGELELAVGQKGYVTQQILVEAVDRGTYPLGRISLVKIPEEVGLWLFDGSAYAGMEAGLLTRRTVGPKDSPWAKNYCIDRDSSTANQVAAGTVSLFDNRSPEWRAWTLDEEGCAYRMTREGRRWKNVYGEQTRYEHQRVDDTRAVIKMELPAGEYFVANWREGFFSPDGETHPDGLQRYTGYWVVAE